MHLWVACCMCEHTSPVEGRWALSGAANNVPKPTMTAVV